jgi:hypothetical protein
MKIFSEEKNKTGPWYRRRIGEIAIRYVQLPKWDIGWVCLHISDRLLNFLKR